MTNFLKLAWSWICPMWGLALYFGGDSSSAQTTENVDARVVGGDNSANISARIDGSSNTFNITDNGAVHDAIQLARFGIESANQVATVTIDQQANMLSGVLDQQRQFSTALKETANKDTTALMVAGLVVVGAVAFAFKKAA